MKRLTRLWTSLRRLGAVVHSPLVAHKGEVRRLSEDGEEDGAAIG
jgi:hypothetical protein